MPYRNLQQGISAIREGRFQEGSRLLRIALNSDELSSGLRATALVWLARTTDNPQEQLNYYQHAVIADPANTEAQQGLARLSGDSPPASPPAAPPPSAPPSTPPPTGVGGAPADPAPPDAARPIDYHNVDKSGPPPPQSLQAAQALARQAATREAHAGVHVLAVDGPNGSGSGFFVSPGGMVATTRFAVSGTTEARITRPDGQVIGGRVVRSFPLLDLALIETGQPVSALPPIDQAEQVAEDIELIVMVHDGKAQRGQRRATRNRIKPEWFPTTFVRHHMRDIGGNPIYNEHGTLVGMLTNNGSRTSSYVFGVNALTIFRCIDHYQQELDIAARDAGGRVVYCPACGGLSRAGGAGARYCELCGCVLPGAASAPPQPQLSYLYDIPDSPPCPNCQSRSGFYNGACLACGY